MKTTCFFFILLLSLPLWVFSQQKANNLSISGSVEYIYKIPAEKKIYKTAFLSFNDSVSKFVHNRVDEESTIKNNVNSNGGNINVNFNVSDTKGSIVYRNFNNKEIRIRTAETRKLFPSFFYDDIWKEITWEIKGKTKKIASFTAQKAIGTFRGRTYTAWFTEEISLPYGPWKLYGLPGLILEAEDSEKMFGIKFVSIKYPCEDCEVDFEKPTASEEKTLKEYVEFRDNYNDHVFRKMKSRLPREIARNFRKGPQKANGRKYRDEKVFEWETESVNDKKD
ncbi:GLPGLI family protein [Dokdonia sp. R86516]|uniref:GLPGLI family protein n=1 Tax=Dokdonia sp. R86516 TaxID=3093856 RepID=UPI0037C96995